MPKRTAEERIFHYREKIRKLEKKQESRRRRRLVILSDSSDSEENECQSQKTEHTPITEAPFEGVTENETQSSPSEPAGQPTQQIDFEGVPTDNNNEASVSPDNKALDPEFLTALGAQPEAELEYGPKIHENLAQLWTPLLKKGMVDEEKTKILKNYLVPENCKLLQAPKLNFEISAAISEKARVRDAKLTKSQQQLGIGISAVNRALDVLVTKDENCTVKATKHLSDACRILCDLHFNESQVRINLVTPSLDKKFLNVIQETQRDETLFGANLAEKIKSSKTIEKQGLQIKKVTVASSAPATSSTRSVPGRGNWSGPSRYSFNKSGRGGKKTSSPAARRPPPPAAPKATRQPSKQARAQTQQ